MTNTGQKQRASRATAAILIFAWLAAAQVGPQQFHE